MKSLRNPTVAFFVAFIVIASILFFIPVNIFDGEILFQGSSQWVPLKLSLSNFIGIGVEDQESQGIVDFRLVGIGYLLAGLLLIAFPFLIAYRVRIANENEARKKAEGTSGKK